MSETQGVKAGEDMAVVVNPETFGESVKAVREARKLTQHTLGQMVGFDARIVSRIEKGKVQPWGYITKRTATKLVGLAEMLGVTFDHKVVPYSEYRDAMNAAREKARIAREKRQVRRERQRAREAEKIKAAVDKSREPMPREFIPEDARAKLAAEAEALRNSSRASAAVPLDAMLDNMALLRDTFERSAQEAQRKSIFENMALMLDLHKEGALPTDALVSALQALIIRGVKS